MTQFYMVTFAVAVACAESWLAITVGRAMKTGVIPTRSRAVTRSREPGAFRWVVRGYLMSMLFIAAVAVALFVTARP